MFRELVRKNRQLSQAECLQVLQQQTRGVLSVLGDGGYPYGMPMNHWYDEQSGKVYFHCGRGGHREDALGREEKVSFCVYEPGTAKEGEWALWVRSVILFGRMRLVEDMDRIVEVTGALSRKFTDDEQYIQEEIRLHGHRTLLLRLTPEHICGKQVEES